MTIEKKWICIRCPKGCELITTLDGYTITSIKGNACKLGESYIKDELKNPVRIVTTTVRVRYGVHPLVPVWTPDPIPKDKILELLPLLKDIELTAPVKIGQIVLENIFGLGINVVTSAPVSANL